MNIQSEFEKWGLGYSGCDGGDIGNPQNKSTWVCGIEWGGGHSPEELIKNLKTNVTTPPPGYDDWEVNISYIFNWQVMKLLTSINEGSVENYKNFAKEEKPFVQGMNGYFKMNLYPIAFKDTDQSKWLNEFSEITGFEIKENYIKWCQSQRFPQIRKWVSESKPEMVICLGKTYIEDFYKAFCNSENSFTSETINNKEINWLVNEDGTLVIVIPFMVNPSGLVKNETIQKVGERISEIKLLTKRSS